MTCWASRLLLVLRTNKARNTSEAHRCIGNGSEEKSVDVLILEADANAGNAISTALPARLSRILFGTIEDVEEFLGERQARIFLCADDLPGETGLMFLARTEQHWRGMHRVLMAPDLDGELFFHTMREVSVFSYLNKPVERGELNRTIHHALLVRGEASEEMLAVPGERLAVPDPWFRMLAVVGCVALIGGVVVAGLLVVFGFLYVAKSLAGVDIFPDWHLTDLFCN